MSNVFTLDSLREEVEKEFAPVKIGLSDGTEVVLKSLLRLGKNAREEITQALKDFEDLGGDEGMSLEDVDLLVESAEGILKRVADRGDALVAELDGDIHLIMQVIKTWMEGTQVGEAESSPDS